jgi:RNA polymerase sigma-70 factor (ECF subfamily)
MPSAGWGGSGYRRRVVERLAQRAEPVPAATAEVVDMVAALRRLPLRQRECLVLFYVAELPVEEICRQLRLPVGTVKSRLARATRPGPAARRRRQPRGGLAW